MVDDEDECRIMTSPLFVIEMLASITISFRDVVSISTA